jgi:hypothetical protein
MAGRAIGLAVLAAALILPRHALATADFYTSDGGTGDCQTPSTPCPFGTATHDAGNTPGGANVHVIGALTITGGAVLPPMGTSNPVHLLGSGSGAGGTLINGGAQTALELDGGSTADSLHATSDADTVRLHYGSTISNSLLETTGSDAAVNSNFGATLPAVVENDTLSAPNGFAAIVGNGGTGMTLVIKDSTLNGMQGLNHTGGVAVSVVVQRSTINATLLGIQWLTNQNATFSVSSSVIHMSGPNTTGVDMYSLGSASTMTLTEDTIDGIDTSGQSAGVAVGPGQSGPPRPNVANLSDSIVRGFNKDLLAQHSTSASIPGGSISVTRSDYGVALGEPPPPMTAGIPGSIGFGGGNVNVDPLFANRAGGDYSLLTGSPVIDAAGADPIDTANSESGSDRAGGARIVDGNGDGAAARDMGAFEFVPPVAAGGAGGAPPTTAALLRARLGGGHRLLVFPPGVLRVPASCVGPAGTTCAITVLARSAKPVSTTAARKKVVAVGRGAGRVAAGKSRKITVRLNKLGRRLFRHGHLSKVKLTVSVSNTAGPAQKAQRVYSLKRAPKKRRR